MVYKVHASIPVAHHFMQETDMYPNANSMMRITIVTSPRSLKFCT